MKNKLDLKLHNENNKLEFLSSYSETAKVVYKGILSKAYDLEILYNKDLASFDCDELDMLIRSKISSSDINTIAAGVSIIINYIRWCYEEKGYERKIDINNDFTFNKLYKYIDFDKAKRKYITKEGFDSLIEFCVNAQDSVIFALLFEGVKGEKFEELLNLRVDDCNFTTNTLSLTRNDGSKRQIIVGNSTIDIIRDTINQERYLKNNGQKNDLFSKKLDVVEIAECPYVIRAGGKKTDKVNQQLISLRVSRILKLYGRLELTPTSIWQSGMLEYARKLYAKKGCPLEKEDYIQINRRFGTRDEYWYKTKVFINSYIKL